MSVIRLAGYTVALILSAYMMSLSMGSRQHLPLALLGLLPLLRAIQVLSVSRAAVSGGVWGAVLALFTADQVSPAAAVLLPASFAAYTGIGAWITRRWGYSPLVLAVGWFVIEIVLRPLSLQAGLIAGTPESAVLLGTVGQVFGYAWVAFLLVFASAWLLSVVSRIRFDLSPAILLPGLGSGQRGLWPLIPSLLPSRAAVRSHPRAPPSRR